MKKFKVIIDTDPGVDDTTALCYVLHNKHFDIKLITTARGNISLENATRNMCHLLDLFHKDIPVVQGYNDRFGNNTEDATFLHTKEGLGGYVPPRSTKHKPQNVDCADAMMEVLQAYPKQITVIVLGPHTNLARLLVKYPNAKDLIKNVVMMGGAPMGIKANPKHNSFNIRTDAPAFGITVASKIPTVMVPSSMGRDVGYFTEAQVNKIEKTNDVGKFLVKTFQTYWEPNYPDRRIATNDICACYYLVHPMLYKTKKADIVVDPTNGKTTANFHRKGKFTVVLGMRRRAFLRVLFRDLKKLNKISLPELATQTKEKHPKSWETNKTQE